MGGGWGYRRGGEGGGRLAPFGGRKARMRVVTVVTMEWEVAVAVEVLQGLTQTLLP